MNQGLCQSCRDVRAIAYVDAADRGYCVNCVVESRTPIGSLGRAMEMLEAIERMALGHIVRKHTANRDCSVEDRQHLAMLLEIDGALQPLSPRNAILAADIIHDETCEKVGGDIRKRAGSVASERGPWHDPSTVAQTFARVSDLLEA